LQESADDTRATCLAPPPRRRPRRVRACTHGSWPTLAARPACRRGKHRWLAPERSLRSARTGFTVVFCRDCPAHYRLVPLRPRGRGGMPDRAV